jgi:8-oxo-dGTP diphosphatase
VFGPAIFLLTMSKSTLSIDRNMLKRVPVVVGIVENNLGRILVTKRRPDAHLGGLWEFPGGKVEAGESDFIALQRELFEEINIQIERAVPFMQKEQTYSDRVVSLHIYRVLAWQGSVKPLEGQPMQWVDPSALSSLEFPSANVAICKRLQLPKKIYITPDVPPSTDIHLFLAWLSKQLEKMPRSFVIWRAPRFNDAQYLEWGKAIQQKIQAAGHHFVAHPTPDRSVLLGCDAVHLSAAVLEQVSVQSIPLDKTTLQWYGASCHNSLELQKAEALGCDYVTASPVLDTNSHPNTTTLGWDQLQELTQRAFVPVYALGGQSQQTLRAALDAGAFGIAGISGFWEETF